MGKKIVHTDHAPRAVGPYSQAIDAGQMIFCSGQIAIDPRTNEFQNVEVTRQADLALKNLGEVLKASGLSYDDVVKTTLFLVDMADFQSVNEVYSKYFSQNPPARSTVAVAALPKMARFEIEAIAIRK